MRIVFQVPRYNPRREGHPWIALVRFKDGHPEFTFGRWTGTPSSGGLLHIDVEEWSIIAVGQTSKTPNKLDATFYIIEDGEPRACSMKEAMMHYAKTT